MIPIQHDNSPRQGPVKTMDVIRKIKAHLSSPPPTTPEDEASRTLRWFDYFNKHFLNTPENDDDILYFVRLQPPNEASPPIFVQRKVGSAVPRLEGLVNWEETFYLNLITKLLSYQVRLVVVDGERVASATQSTIYAEPSRYGSKGMLCSFPIIYFASHNEGLQPLSLSKGQALCVELRSLLADPHRADDEHDAPDTKYTAWGIDSNMQILFQGAVTYESLLKVHAKKAGLRPAQPQTVLMKGPEGRGHAQIHVTNLNAQSQGSLTANLARITRNGPERDRKVPTLSCTFDFIHLPWRLIVLDHFRHPQSNLPACGKRC